MIRFSHFITEKYHNLFPQHTAEREKHKHEVYNMLQKSYESQGGIKGNGFKDADDMVKNIPFWKIHKNGKGEITHVILSKDKNGRKPVALGTNGTKEGKDALAHTMHHELGRSHMEISGNLLSFYKKNIGPILPHAHTIDQVRKMNPDDEIRRPPEDDEEMVKHPELKDHLYQRKLGDGEWHTKLSAGTVGNKLYQK